ncbi:hypothetical protein GTP46_00110 [Duganella sp. FT135W]|uniref:Uncharacterized protein n=1 Tax=Duganella flavida TaxID=2692175 RepID=A0A6L8K549_9BURK|nr:hypothetical protein [Duganella flavida]MYM21052.1 hypothetical protein [Duganella flavida]
MAILRRSPLLILLCLGACAPAQRDGVPPATASASACVATPSTPPAATSKLRHIPDENAACPTSQGLAPR